MKYSNHLKTKGPLQRPGSKLAFKLSLKAGLFSLMAGAIFAAPQAANAQGDDSANQAPNISQFTVSAPNYFTPDGKEFFRQGFASPATLIPLSLFSPELQSSAQNLELLGNTYQPGELQTAGDAVIAQFAGAAGLEAFVSALQAATASSQQFSDTIKGFLTDDNQIALGELAPLAANSEDLRGKLLALLAALNAMPRNGTPEQDAAIASLFTAISNATTALEQAAPVSGQFSAEMDTWR